MTKVILLGDTHFGATRSSDIVHDYMSLFYTDLFEYMNTHSIKHIIQEGDKFDRRSEVHFNTLYRTEKYFFNRLVEHDIKCYAIAGNHDCLYKNTNKINSISLLKHPQIHVVDLVPKTIKIDGVPIDLYPWINQENLDKTKKLAQSPKSKIAIGHFEFANFPMYPGSISEGGMDHSIFTQYEQVFSGHYHTQSNKDNVFYTGTPYELNWSDYNDPKGFWVLDLDTMEKTFVQNRHQLFQKIIYVEDMSFDFSSVKDKYVKLIVGTKISQKKFDTFIDSVKINLPHDLKIIEAAIAEAVSAAMNTKVDVISTQTMIESVIDNLETNLDKSLLKTHVLETYAEAMSILNSL